MKRQTQLQMTKKFLLNGWCTLFAIANACNASDSGISARVRDLRKKQYGGYNVVKRKISRNTWQYRIHESNRINLEA